MSPRDPIDDDEFRAEVCDWFRANGVDPGKVFAEANASVSGGQLTYVGKVQRDGRDVIAPDRPLRVLTETVTVPVVVPPTGDVAEWLRPHCPTCGR